MKSSFKLMPRDIEVFKLIWRFRFCLGRHIKSLCGFSGNRTCNARLKKLVEAGYLERKYYLYGVPAIYTITYQAACVSSIKHYKHKIRLEQIEHDITVLDTVVYFIQKRNINILDIITLKELNSNNGFGVRKHQPDFIIEFQNKTVAVEIELTPKSKERFLKNVEDNFMRFDSQIWIIPKDGRKLNSYLKEAMASYIDIMLIDLGVILACARG